jgi:hypothetical protein
MPKKIKGVNKDHISNVASDLLADTIYSFATDLLRELHRDENVQDLDRAIATVNEVTKNISIGGLKLRKANVERRTRDRKEDVVIEKEDVTWTKYPKDRKLEYTADIMVNNKYILKKRKQDVVVGLLTEEQLEGDDDVVYKMSSKEKEKVFTMGFGMDLEYK